MAGLNGYLLPVVPNVYIQPTPLRVSHQIAVATTCGHRMQSISHYIVRHLQTTDEQKKHKIQGDMMKCFCEQQPRLRSPKSGSVSFETIAQHSVRVSYCRPTTRVSTYDNYRARCVRWSVAQIFVRTSALSVIHTLTLTQRVRNKPTLFPFKFK